MTELDAASPPQISRRRSLLAITVVVLITATAAAVLSRSVIAPAADLPEVTTLLPRDGDLIVLEMRTSSSTRLLVQEHQWLRGIRALTALPDSIAAQILGGLPDGDPSDLLFWRVGSRQMSDGLIGPHTTDLFRVDDGGLHRLAAYGGNYPTIYEPPLLLVPPTPSIGQTWNATGSALLGGLLSYEYQGEVEDLDDEGCVVVTIALDLRLAESPFASERSRQRWCPARGVVSGRAEFDQGSGPEPIDYGISQDLDALRQAAPATPATDMAPTSPSTWQSRRARLIHRDALLGDMALGGITGIPPQAREGGHLITVMGNGAALIGLQVGTPAEDAPPEEIAVLEQWRVHPGGDPLAFALQEDLILVTTSTRRLAAYDLNGVRRWHHDTEDLVLSAPVRIRLDAGADIVVMQDLSGRVTALDAQSGEARWRERTRTDSDLGPAPLGDLVVVADRSGELLALGAATGERRWVRRLPSIAALGSVGEQVIVALTDGVVQALDAGGRTRWATEAGSAALRVDEVAQQPALISRDRVTVLDPDTGATRWSVPVLRWAAGWAGGLAIHQGAEICTYDPAGEPTGCWADPDGEARVGTYVVAEATGLWVVDSGLAATRIAAPDGENGS